MMYYNIGILIIFILYFIYDVNSVIWKNRLLNKLFILGTICLLGENLLLFIKFMPSIIINYFNIFFIILAILFFLLLIYTLFFALPFSNTYVDISSKRKVIKTGVYSLSRHIGVFWFILMYLCLTLIINNLDFTLFAILACGLNILYIIFQDNYTFMKLFDDYLDYKKSVPFLIPNFKHYNKGV